ncbi:Hypothetical predicted protein [Podarcis lilfordi]|uniref:Uncharacterized protein n=1 Tax=Podarcis lilfordi TaxID=74358 RepID=A0AA35JPC4_9SAUR|nr:Hypothetical predicted protein [Podarcis lilfordi]
MRPRSGRLFDLETGERSPQRGRPFPPLPGSAERPGRRAVLCQQRSLGEEAKSFSASRRGPRRSREDRRLAGREAALQRGSAPEGRQVAQPSGLRRHRRPSDCSCKLAGWLLGVAVLQQAEPGEGSRQGGLPRLSII